MSVARSLNLGRLNLVVIVHGVLLDLSDETNLAIIFIRKRSIPFLAARVLIAG